ncbi:MAG: hypothetical protein BM555_05155 [Crocinitomix sp. MedPE-SWsnd]|nr:MAG: hypothetical protein BM555_05155 [Crocinitomix sp. MedPE-SWsnd]
MLSKEEKKNLRIEFWNKLEKQLENITNPHGSKVKWMNYNTSVKHLYFRMEADEEGARLCIDLQFPDDGIRSLYWEQFLEFNNILTEKFKDLIWIESFEHTNGKTVSRISVSKDGCHLWNRDDWDKMHLFLKINFKKLDEFWTEFGEVFVNLK